MNLETGFGDQVPETWTVFADTEDKETGFWDRVPETWTLFAD